MPFWLVNYPGDAPILPGSDLPDAGDGTASRTLSCSGTVLCLSSAARR